MTNQSPVEQEVMRRVRRIAILRIVVSGAVFAITVALLALYGIGREVWVAKIFENGPEGLGGQLLYLFYAFEHTRFVVQVLAVICGLSLIYLAREVARLISNTVVPKRA